MYYRRWHTEGGLLRYQRWKLARIVSCLYPQGGTLAKQATVQAGEAIAYAARKKQKQANQACNCILFHPSFGSEGGDAPA